jgi:hypothetical protein
LRRAGCDLSRSNGAAHNRFARGVHGFESRPIEIDNPDRAHLLRPSKLTSRV